MPATQATGSLSIVAAPVDDLPPLLAVYGVEMPLGTPLNTIALAVHLHELATLDRPTMILCYLMVSRYLPAPRNCSWPEKAQPAHKCQQPLLVTLTDILPETTGRKRHVRLAGYFLDGNAGRQYFTGWLTVSTPQIGILRATQVETGVRKA